MIDTGLKNKVVMITGANNSVGNAIAFAFAEEGVKLIIHLMKVSSSEKTIFEENEKTDSKNKENLVNLKIGDKIVNKIREKGGNAQAFESDLITDESIQQLFDAAEAEFGPVDILINNAKYWEADTFIPVKVKKGRKWSTPPKTISFENFNNHFFINTRSVVLAMAEFTKRYLNRDANWGRIVNISTDKSDCYPSEVSYGASKLALEGYSRSAATELGQFGITVNIISPGIVQTGWLPPEVEKEIAETYPLRRVGYPEDIANVILFLASEQARWVTGQTIYVSGGHKM